jgi:hypothetical protein
VAEGVEVVRCRGIDSGRFKVQCNRSRVEGDNGIEMRRTATMLRRCFGRADRHALTARPRSGGASRRTA